jgi:uncharacterized protein
MRRESEGVLLRVFIGDADLCAGRPLYQVLVERARELGLKGATVLHGSMGFGRHSRVRTAKLVELSGDLPLVVEVVDSQEAVDRFLPVVDELVREGLVTVEKVSILDYSGGE